MSHQQGDYVDYIEDEYELKELDEFIYEFQDELQGINLDDFDLDVDEFLGVDFGSFDSDVDEFEYMNQRMQDILDAEVRKGNDIEGIPWERATITR
ncbi:hypothetical protein H5410_004452 [Solanum commersonii]|uniref:Uncharacterized protein n=1 Tax=Solanum commersonii TaxID=4109 RepID=A0A9J6B8G3_SOLCO|nr:hypothetical protein H5410_004452 [Solanum commersonii]